MRLVSYRAAGAESFGVLRDEVVVDAAALLGVPTLRAALAADRIGELAGLAASAQPSHRLADVELLPPITDPAKIFCIGVNYVDHRAESGLTQPPTHPTVFTRFSDTHVGHDQPIVAPANSQQLDYEGEVALVIGKPISTLLGDDEALAAIAGISCYNDVSARDWQLHNSQWTPGKNFSGLGSFGPWITTLDDIEHLDDVSLTTRVNGEVRQEATLADLIFDFPTILRYLAGFTTLAPGDVVVTGTPGGVGVVADPPVFLRPGDMTEIEVSGVGALRNTIAPAHQEGEGR
jgi:2-keto-4-pentenoate hydratase/2-oxohepta-3-ene-1,7-dioic acid hydratase in catechol pathway